MTDSDGHWTSSIRVVVVVVDSDHARCGYLPRCGVGRGRKIDQIAAISDAATGRGLVVGEDDFDAAGKTDGDVVQERKQRG